MTLFGASECLEPFRDLLETFVAGGPREAGVHLCVLVGLAGHRRLEVVFAGSDGDARGRVADFGEEVEVTEGVAGLALGDGAEQRRHVGVSLDVGFLREVQVAAVGLALAGERRFQVLVGLGSIELGHVDMAPLGWLMNSCRSDRGRSPAPRRR